MNQNIYFNNNNMFNCFMQGDDIIAIDYYGQRVIGKSTVYIDNAISIMERLKKENDDYKQKLIDNGLLEVEKTPDELKAENKHLKDRLDKLENKINQLTKKAKKENTENQNNEGVNNDVNY